MRPGSDVFDASTMTDLFSNQTLENKRCHTGQWVIRNYKLCTHTVVSSAQQSVQSLQWDSQDCKYVRDGNYFWSEMTHW